MASRLDDPGYAERVAELLSHGMTYGDAAKALGDGTHKDTVARWVRDPRVQAHLSRMREERVNRVTRKLDKEIEDRLNNAAAIRELDMKDLVALRRELLGPAAQRMVISRGADEAEATAELMAILAGNPELAAALGAEGVAEGHLLEPATVDDEPEDT